LSIASRVFREWISLKTGFSRTHCVSQVNMAFIFHARVVALRDMGGCQNPFGSFMLLQGIETLPLRGRVRTPDLLAFTFTSTSGISGRHSTPTRAGHV
jgi:O-acetylhomoserine (thiol)-lyase